MRRGSGLRKIVRVIGNPKSPELGRLRLLAVLLPAGAMGAFEFLRHQWLSHAPNGSWKILDGSPRLRTAVVLPES